MDYDETYTELNIILGDTANVTFTPEEKARALKKAWNDSYVSVPVTGNSLTFATGTRNYAMPTDFTTITEVGLSPTNTLDSAFVEWVDRGLWEVQGGSLVFKNNANGIIPSGYVLYLKGRKKLDWESDTLDDVKLQEYVLALATLNTLTMLGSKKANLFLKNDLSMAELIAWKRELRTDVQELRGKLATEYQGG